MLDLSMQTFKNNDSNTDLPFSGPSCQTQDRLRLFAVLWCCLTSGLILISFTQSLLTPQVNKLIQKDKPCVKSITDLFIQESVPLISIMCNPGLRGRHWQEMSALAGMDITPDAGSTLRKVIKLRLDNFLDQFEVISGAASKVPCHNKTKRCTTTQSRRKQLCPCL